MEAGVRTQQFSVRRERETPWAKLGRTSYLVAADAVFYATKKEAAAKAKGVGRICVSNRSIWGKSKKRRFEQRKRWFRKGRDGGPDLGCFGRCCGCVKGKMVVIVER